MIYFDKCILVNKRWEIKIISSLSIREISYAKLEKSFVKGMLRFLTNNWIVYAFNNQLTNMHDQDIYRFMDGAKVKIWPAKQQKRLLILEYLVSKFEFDKFYTEKQVNDLIDQYQTFGDHATIRRDLYENKFLDRDNYGTQY